MARFSDAFKIGTKTVGPGHPCFIIAEAGVNHNGDMDLARQLIDKAVAAGVDAVKFQTFKAEHVVSEVAPKAAYQKETTDIEESQLDMERRLELPFENFIDLQDYCRKKDIIFLSSPFDMGSIDFLSSINIPAFKVPSGEIDNPLFFRRLARTNVPIIFSTGMADMQEVGRAATWLDEEGARDICILHCVSNYPARPEDMNLRAMETLRNNYQVPVGLSDHTPGVEIAIAAVALGANLVEKHFTLDKSMDGPDHQASLDPEELKALVTGIRNVEMAFGNGIKTPKPSEEDTRNVARRSLFLTRTIAAGDIIQLDDLIALRPSGGIPPFDLDKVIGKKSRIDLDEGAMLTWQDLT